MFSLIIYNLQVVFTLQLLLKAAILTFWKAMQN